MADNDKSNIPLPNLDRNSGEVAPEDAEAGADQGMTARSAADLEAVFDVPVQVSAVLGRARMDVGDLLNLAPGAVLELDRRVGEAIDIYVNNRLVARGEVVLVEEKLGVTMTEIIKRTAPDATRAGHANKRNGGMTCGC
jgi:flagellar motor switch protein FliN/FliY